MMARNAPQVTPKASDPEFAPNYHISLDGSIRQNFPNMPGTAIDAEQVTLVLGREDDEILATVLRGLLSKTDEWSLREITFPETGRVGWKFSINSFVLMDSKFANAIEEVFPSYTGKLSGKLENDANSTLEVDQ